MTATVCQPPADLDAGQTTTTTTSSNVSRLPVEYRQRPDEVAVKPARTKRTRKATEPKPRKYRLKELVEAHPTLNASAKLIGAKTCELFDLDEECAFPSNAWFKTQLNVSPSTVRRAFVALEGAGLMRREINAAKCGQNRIWPNWSKLPALVEPVSDASADDGQPQSPATAQGGQPRLPQACRDDEGGQSTLTAVRQAESKQENQAEHNREKGAPKGAVSLEVMDSWFDLFWERYPRQEDPQAARREFERVINQNGGGDAFEELMENLMAYRKHVGTEIVFKPANWLSKGKWRVTRTAPAPRPVVDHRSRQWRGAGASAWG